MATEEVDAGPFTGLTLMIPLPSRNQAVQLQRLLVPPG